MWLFSRTSTPIGQPSTTATATFFLGAKSPFIAGSSNVKCTRRSAGLSLSRLGRCARYSPCVASTHAAQASRCLARHASTSLDIKRAVRREARNHSSLALKKIGKAAVDQWLINPARHYLHTLSREPASRARRRCCAQPLSRHANACAIRAWCSARYAPSLPIRKAVGPPTC